MYHRLQTICPKIRPQTLFFLGEKSYQTFMKYSENSWMETVLGQGMRIFLLFVQFNFLGNSMEPKLETWLYSSLCSLCVFAVDNVLITSQMLYSTCQRNNVWYLSWGIDSYFPAELAQLNISLYTTFLLHHNVIVMM